MAAEAPNKDVAVVLVEVEALFLDLLQRFPARRYPLVFAADLAEARQLFEDKGEPRLLIVPVSADNSTRVEPLLKAARAADARVLGLGTPEGVPAGLSEKVDQLVVADDVEAVLTAAARLLEERRGAPRARVAVPVAVGQLGQLTATVISARSLFVPTETPLDGGQMVQLSLESGTGALTCWASVLRVGPGELGERGMVLGVPERERAVRAYLDGLVRGALLLEHVEQVPETAVPGAAGQRLSEHLQRDVAMLRQTLQAQMALSDALGDRLDALAAAEARTVKWQDVKPLLARKLSTQQQQIKSLLERVDELTQSQALAEELREALQAQDQLQEQLQQQQQVIDGLRQQIDHLRAMAAAVPGGIPAAQGTVAGLSQLLHQLLARVEQLESGPAAPAAPANEDLTRYGDRVVELTCGIERLQDQLRLGGLPPQQFAKLEQHLERGQRELQEHLAAMERGEWVPLPQVSDFELSNDEEPTVPGVVVDADVANLQPLAVAATPALGVGLGEASFEDETADVPLSALAARPDLSMPGSPVPAVPLASSAEVLPDDDALAPARPSRRWPLVAAVGGAVVVLAIGVGWMLLESRGSLPSEPVDAMLSLATAHGASDERAVGAAVDGPDAATAAAADASSAPASVDAGHVAPDTSSADRPAAAGEDPGADDAGTAIDPAAARPRPALSGRALRRHRAAVRRRLRQGHLRTASALLRQKKYVESRDPATKALQIADDHQVRELLARSHEGAGELWPAIYHLRKAVGSAPAGLRPALHDRLGLAYARAGKTAAACAAFRAALAARPDLHTAQAHQARYCR